MRPFIYILLLAAIAMFYKTFYLDYKKKEVPVEVNASVETPAESQPEPKPVVNTADEANRTGWQSRKGMPIDRLGDTIGDSLKEKIKVQ